MSDLPDIPDAELIVFGWETLAWADKAFEEVERRGVVPEGRMRVYRGMAGLNRATPSVSDPVRLHEWARLVVTFAGNLAHELGLPDAPRAKSSSAPWKTWRRT